MSTPKKAVGRPKVDKKYVPRSIQLSPEQDAAVETYRANNGLRSVAEAIRLMVEKATGVK